MKKRILCLLLSLLLVVSLVGCKKDTPKPPTVVIDGDTTLIGDSTNAEYVTKYFTETDEVIAENPGMGWVMLEEPTYGGLPAVGYVGDFPEVKNVSYSMAWDNVEVAPNVFDWTTMDETIAYWASRGKKINFRLCTDSLFIGYIYEAVPEYIYEPPYNVPYEWTEQGGTTYRVPDITSEAYQERLKNFLDAFAGKFLDPEYEYHDAIDVVELRGYGDFGEWHSGWSKYTSVEERVDALKKIIKIWRDAWQDKLLVISCTYEFANKMWGVLNPRTYEDFMYYMAYDYAMSLPNIAFRRDGIAFALRKWDGRFAMDYYWLNNGLPLLGECGGGYATFREDSPTYNGVWNLMDSYNEALIKWRVNYQTCTGWVGQDFNEVIKNDAEAVKYFMNHMGYRYIPNRMQYSRNVKAGDKLYIDSLWSNEAFGRAWEDINLKIALEKDGKTVYEAVDTAFNARFINMDEPQFFRSAFDLPDTLEKGAYDVKFSLVTAGGTVIRLAIAGNDGKSAYKLGTVNVGDSVSKPISAVDDLDHDTAFAPVGSGAITARSVNVDGTKAAVGAGSGVFARGYTLSAGKTYYVSFDLKTDKKYEDVVINDKSRYTVGAYDFEQNEWLDQVRFLDTSNMRARRTAVITVPAGKNAALAFGCEHNAATIAIDNITVAAADAATTGITVLDEDTAETDGTYALLSAVNKAMLDCVKIDVALEKYTTYMFTFDAMTTAEIGAGGYFYIGLRDRQNPDSFERIGAFYMPDDYGFLRYSFVYNTGDIENRDLVMGITNMGGYNMRNLKVTRLESGITVLGDGAEFTWNVKPDKGIDVNSKILYENFETGAFNGTSMFPGDNSCGVIVHDSGTGAGDHVPENIISGKYSCMGKNLDDNYTFWQWKVFCWTHDIDTQLSPDTTYRVKFKFKILVDPTEVPDGYKNPDNLKPQFYMMSRLRGSFSKDTDLIAWNLNTLDSAGNALEKGQVYSVEHIVHTNAAKGVYGINWGIQVYGQIVIDDVVIEKVDDALYVKNSEGTFTKGHAYEITQDKLYSRPED